jgi:hypothetical protein
MADEQINRIALEVTDGIQPSIAPNLRAIGEAARATDKEIISLKKQLANISGANFSLKDQIASTIINKLDAILSFIKEIGVQANVTSAAINGIDGSSLSVLVEQLDAVSAGLTRLEGSATAVKSNLAAIQLVDEISPTIAPKLVEISVAAKEALANVAALKVELQAASNGSINDLTSANIAVGNSQKYSAEATLKSAQVAQQLIGARSTLKTATKNLETAEKDLGVAAQQGNVSAQEVIAQYRKEAEAAALYVAQLKNLRAEANAVNTSNRNVARGTHTVVSEVQGASAVIRGLEGNMGTNVRAAERFLVTTLKLGPALQAAFPIFGALALIGVVDILAEHVTKLIDAYKELSVTQQANATNAIIQGERIIKAQKDGFISASNFARLLAGAESGPKEIQVPNISVELKQLQLKESLAKATSAANEQGLQGAAQEKQRIKDLEDEVGFAKQRLSLAKQYRDELKKRLDENQDVRSLTVKPGLAGAVQFEQRQVPKITDPKQRKALQDQLSLAVQAAGSTDISPKGVLGELENEVGVLEQKLRGAKLALPLKELKDETIAARNQMKAFSLEMSSLKQQDHVVSPQEQLSLLQSQLQRALPSNKPKIESEIAQATQEIERQKNEIGALKERYQDAAESIGLYSDALREKNLIDKLDLQIAKDRLQISPQERQGIIDNIKYTVENARYERELKSVYEEMNGPQQTFMAAQKAIAQLQHEGAISAAQAAIATNEARNAYENAVNPMKRYQDEWQRETDLIGKYGSELQAAIEVQQIEQDLKQRGRILNQQERSDLTATITQLQRQREIQENVNQLYEQTYGAIQKVLRAITSLNIAKERGIITEEKYNVELAKQKVEFANVGIEMGKFTKNNVLTSVFGGYLKDFKGFTTGVVKLWGDTFNTIADGAADAFGRAIVYGEDLGAALKDVARQALSQLISGMIKLGIQTLISTVIAKTASAGLVAASLAEAAALATAWWDVAAAVSLSTFGANAAPAAAGMISTATLGEILGSVAALKDGGLVRGPGGIDNVPARLTAGEFVMTKSAVDRIGLPFLHALNDGYTIQNNVQSAPAQVGGPHIEIIHDGSTNVRVESVTPSKVRLIARQEAVQAVEDHAPRVVAADMRNANSRTSKAMKQTKTVRELR